MNAEIIAALEEVLVRMKKEADMHLWLRGFLHGIREHVVGLADLERKYRSRDKIWEQTDLVLLLAYLQWFETLGVSGRLDIRMQSMDETVSLEGVQLREILATFFPLNKTAEYVASTFSTLPFWLEITYRDPNLGLM